MKAILVLSGDHEGTLMVPWPPKSLAMVWIFPPPAGIMRSMTGWFSGWPLTPFW